MQSIHFLLVLLASISLAITEPSSVTKRPLIFHHWPQNPMNKHLTLGRGASGKQRTLVVQIRSDQPVPLVLKGRPPAATHAHLYHAGNSHHYNRPIGPPIKLSPPIYHHLKSGSALGTKPLLSRKPLKLKMISNQKLKSLKSALIARDKPYQYEFPTTAATIPSASFSHLNSLQQQLPVSLFLIEPLASIEDHLASYKPTHRVHSKPFPNKPDHAQTTVHSKFQPNSSLQLESHAQFISDHFVPIHTIPAPNLAPLHDNHIHHDEHFDSQTHHSSDSVYQVHEELTNDHTIVDPHSGTQKLYAPDPDPALPAAKVRPALESYNQPSNGKPLPADVHSNYLPPVAQPLVQIVGAQSQPTELALPEIYPIQLAQSRPVQLQAFSNTGVVAPVPAHSPTYLVAQSNNLYTQHQQQQQQQQQLLQQQLFKPAVVGVVENGYANSDLTQEVASNGQILQAAKDLQSNIPLATIDDAPQFAALIAAPALGDAHAHAQQQQSFTVAAPFRLSNAGATGAAPTASENSFVVSNIFGDVQDSLQLLQSHAEEQKQHQRQQQQQQLQQLEAEKQLQQLQEEQQLFLQQQQNQLIELQQQQQQLLAQQQHHLEQQQLQQQLQAFQQQQLRQQQQPQYTASFEGKQHSQRLADVPLRIFVPDEEFEAGARLKKRSDNPQDTNATKSSAADENESK